MTILEKTEFFAPSIHVCSQDKIGKKLGVGRKHEGPVATTTSQIMDYFTAKNIEISISYRQNEWVQFVLKELMDNAYEWLNDYYPAKRAEDKEIRKISVRIWVPEESNNKKFIHIAVRNSNVNNQLAFQNLEKVFDYHIWYSTKRNQHRMTCGSLGDALKRSLGMGYASWTEDYNPDETFDDKQWNEPIIIRCNGQEFNVFLKVDTSIPDAHVDILQDKPTRDIGPDTEVEVTLPLPMHYIGLKDLEILYLESKIGKSRTSFDFCCGDI